MKIPTSPQKPRTSQRTTAVGKEAAVQWTHRQTKDLPPTVLDHSEELLKPAPQDASSYQKEAPRLCRGGSRSLTFQEVVHRRDFQS